MKLRSKLASIFIPVTLLVSGYVNAAETASITSIKDKQLVTTPEYLDGICSDIQEGTFLWVVVRPKYTDNYHPQSNQDNHGAISNGCNGTWEGIAYIGESASKNKNEKFEIYIVGVNQKGSIEMQNYLVQANQTHRWDGMSALPKGTTKYQQIEVTRR